MSQAQFPKKWIFLRGLTRSQFHWKEFLSDFKTAFQPESIECVELQGNGYLAHEPTPTNIDEAVKNLKSQISTKPGETYGILAVSLGGMIATRWAQLEPELFTHIVLINSSSSLSPFYQRLMPQNYLNILKLLGQPNPENIEEMILKMTSNLFEEKRDKYLKENVEFIKQHPIKIKSFVTQLLLSSQIDFKNVPKSKKLILASKKDRLVSVSCSEKIASTWGCPIRFHETAGHDLSLDDGPWIINTLKNELT